MSILRIILAANGICLIQRQVLRGNWALNKLLLSESMRYVSLFFLLWCCAKGNPDCLYDHTKDFAYNCTREYPLCQPIYQRNKTFSKKDLFGYPIASPIGISACAITTSNGIAWASRSGYDILTYKTVRSSPYSGHPLPHLAHLEIVDGKMIALPSDVPLEEEEITIANSIGIACLDLSWVLQDIAKARRSLLPGQVLIVSIMGSASEDRTLEEDFAILARAAVVAGAQIVEANLSCPNLHSPFFIYKDPVAVSSIATAISKSVPNIPVILKVGVFDSFDQMKEVFQAATASHAKGICGINSIGTNIYDREGGPAFGPGREKAGVSGSYLRPFALEFIRQARQIIDEEGLDLALLATGGITKPEHFILFLEAGADIALSATGAMWNPDLARQFQQLRVETNFFPHHVNRHEVRGPG